MWKIVQVAPLLILFSSVVVINSSPSAEVYKPKHCGISNSNPFSDRIVGGKESEPHEFPWLTKIYYWSGGPVYFQCGGSLITDRHVISAGHCVSSYKEGASIEPRKLRRGNEVNYDVTPAKDLFCEFGTHLFDDKSPGIVKRNVTKVFLHPDYDVFAARRIMVQTNDVSILAFDPVEFSHTIQPICLPAKDSEINDGARFIVAGWGSTNMETIDQQRTKLPKALMKTEITKIPFETCQKNRFVGWLLKDDFDLTDKEIFCGLGNSTDSCRGDSGGAAMLKTKKGIVLAGIVSWGIGCSVPDYPAAYARLSNYIDFIEEHTRDGKWLPHLSL